jgi:hypothetical protein
MAAFVTLCEAYIGIEPPLNLWSHFFRAQLLHDSGTGAASLGSVDISVHSDPGVDSYFSIPQHDPRWRKARFLLKDKVGAPLFTFTGGCLVPHPSWEHGVAQIDFPPAVAPAGDRGGGGGGLLKKGLTGEEIMWTFLSRGVQPLRQ